MSKSETTAALTVIAPDTGEIIPINVGAAQAPSTVDTKEAAPLDSIDGAFMVAGIQYGVGKTYEGEYAIMLVVDATKQAKVVRTASDEIIGTLRRMETRYGACTPEHPLGPMMADKAKTSNGFTVHKLRVPAEADAKKLLAALAS